MNITADANKAAKPSFENMTASRKESLVQGFVCRPPGGVLMRSVVAVFVYS